MTNHIRFLETNKTVCQAPRSLGYDFVVIDYAEGESCQACLSLILVHNHRHKNYDLLVTLPEKAGYSVEEEETTTVRAFGTGLLVATSFWLTLIVILWAVFYA